MSEGLKNIGSGLHGVGNVGVGVVRAHKPGLVQRRVKYTPRSSLTRKKRFKRGLLVFMKC
jgi:hypothetical protein